MPGSTFMPSVEVAASPECAVLITATRPGYLYVCVDTIGSVASTNPDHQRTQLAFFEVGACFVLWRTSAPRVPDVFAVAQTPNVKLSELVK